MCDRTVISYECRENVLDALWTPRRFGVGETRPAELTQAVPLFVGLHILQTVFYDLLFSLHRAQHHDPFTLAYWPKKLKYCTTRRLQLPAIYQYIDRKRKNFPRQK